MKDKCVLKNPRSITGHFHDDPSSNRNAKRLRSRQRRIAVDKLSQEELDMAFEAMMSTDDFEVVNRVLDYEERMNKTLTERAIELMTQCGYDPTAEFDHELFSAALGRCNAYVVLQCSGIGSHIVAAA